MPVPEPVLPLEPWQTAWPAGVALVGWAVAAWRVRRHVRFERTVVLWMLGLWALSMVVRLGVLPATTAHYFDGHEAEYWDLFRGVRDLSRGGTVLYPSMQWMWWGLGKVLPHHRLVPISAMAGLASLGVILVADAGRLLAGRRAGLVVGGLLALHPVHAAWSSSAYNVMVPWFFTAVMVWCAAQLVRAHRPAKSWVWLAAFSWVLVAATRMEAAWVGLPALLIAVSSASPGESRSKTLRRRWPWLGPVGAGIVVAGAAIVPLVFPGEVPGAGERALSFCINRAWFDPYQPFGTTLAATVLAGTWVLSLRERPLISAIAGVCTVGAHLALASFDDFGDRHTLGSLIWMVLWVGIAAGRQETAGWLGLGGAGVLFVLCAQGVLDMRERFYGSEEAYAEVLKTDPIWSDLPRWSPTAARAGCGWISEDPRVAPQPQKSHFNLIDPAEAAALRSASGCLRWCVDVQDWRWSSRGVRDRALRTVRLFDTRPVAVVEDAGSGYACLVMALESRRCCSTGAPSKRPGERDPTASTSPPSPHASSSEEDDASGTLHNSRIP